MKNNLLMKCFSLCRGRKYNFSSPVLSPSLAEVPVIKESNKRKPNLLTCMPHVYMEDTQERKKKRTTLRSGLDLRLRYQLLLKTKRKVLRENQLCGSDQEKERLSLPCR